MADWQKIKTEYITTDTSYRKLGQKYGIHYKVISQKGKDEKWVELRSQHRDKTLTNTLDAISDQQVDRAANLISVADQLLVKVQNIIENGSELLAGPQNLKHLSGVLKDIKEIQMIRSDADMREQEARINKLQKEADREDDGSAEITITFGSEDAERWAK